MSASGRCQQNAAAGRSPPSSASGPTSAHWLRNLTLSGREEGEVTRSVVCSSTVAGPSGYTEDDREPALDGTLSDPTPTPPGSGIEAVKVVGAVLVVVSLAALVATLASGGPQALAAALSRSGFAAAFSLIFVSEIGDKTFFIAALLAMRHSRILVLLGAVTALSLMTAISVVIGRLFQRVPAQLQTALPVGEYAAVALLVWFGFRAIRNALAMPDKSKGLSADSESELAEAEAAVRQRQADLMRTPFSVFWESLTLIFAAEWGDRSMLATIALGAAQEPIGVASGAILGHFLATGIAVLGGALLSKYISEKTVGLIGGILFFAFAIATLAGVY